MLLNAAVSFGAEYVATGHYVRTDGERLYMGKPDCDQSYMLSRLTHDQVCRLLLPLGEMNKSRVRELASSLGFSCASRPDSRENCFIGDKSYVSYLERTYGDRIPGGGDVVYEGKTIGRHDGIYRYTVGQRWKDYIGERRAYVKRIDAKENTIELCLWEQLFTNRVRLGDISFISGSAPADEFDGAIRVRHTRWETPPCHVIMAGEDTAYVETASPLRAPAPGQSAALYSGDMLLGGGTVEEC